MNGSRDHTLLISVAPRVCVWCQRRKRKCDKAIPSCQNCIKTGHVCRYYDSGQNSNLDAVRDLQITSNKSQNPIPILRNISPFEDGDVDVRCIDHDHWNGHILAKRQPEPIYKRSLSLGDCFSATRIGIALGSDMPKPFQHFFRQFTIFNSSFYPLAPLGIQSMCANSSIIESEPALLHALCFTGAMHLAASRLRDVDLALLGSGHCERRIVQNAIVHKSRALSLINKTLADPNRATTDSSIITVTLLFALEGFSGNLHSAEIHSRGLARMVKMRGGLSALAPSIVGEIYTSDTKTAAVDLSKPAFPLTNYWKQRMDLLSVTEFEPGPVLPFLATRFFDTDLIHLFHPDMLRNFRFMRHLINHTEFAKSQRCSKPIASYTIGEYIVAEHILLSFPYEGHSIKTTNEHVQECTRIAALLYCNLSLWTCPRYLALVKALAISLRQAILKLDFILRGRIYPDLMLWVLFMGCFAAEGKPERSWYIHNIAGVTKSLGLREWVEVKRLLVKFFYTERLHDVPFAKIWDEAFLIVDDS